MSAAHQDAAGRLADALIHHGMSAEVDAPERTLAARVRDAQHRHIPCVAVIGDRESADGAVALRFRDGRKLSLSRGEFIQRLTTAVAAHATDP